MYKAEKVQRERGEKAFDANRNAAAQQAAQAAQDAAIDADANASATADWSPSVTPTPRDESFQQNTPRSTHSPSWLPNHNGAPHHTKHIIQHILTMALLPWSSLHYHTHAHITIER